MLWSPASFVRRNFPHPGDESASGSGASSPVSRPRAVGIIPTAADFLIVYGEARASGGARGGGG
jgi:hypothetical protein